jgi:hypothetical protein
MLFDLQEKLPGSSCVKSAEDEASGTLASLTLGNIGHFWMSKFVKLSSAVKCAKPLLVTFVLRMFNFSNLDNPLIMLRHSSLML